jgi:hypothetical protein
MCGEHPCKHELFAPYSVMLCRGAKVYVALNILVSSAWQLVIVIFVLFDALAPAQAAAGVSTSSVFGRISNGCALVYLLCCALTESPGLCCSLLDFGAAGV